MSDPRDGWSMHHFAQSNSPSPGQGDVSALLRRVADTLDGLGDVQVMDLTFSSTPTAEEDDLQLTVYYNYHHRQPRRR